MIDSGNEYEYALSEICPPQNLIQGDPIIWLVDQHCLDQIEQILVILHIALLIVL